jgi:thiol-disulfide isomerase/thioredoxin
MLKNLIPTHLLALLVCLSATFGAAAQKPAKKSIVLKGMLTNANGNCPADTIRLYQWSVAMPQEFAKARMTYADGNSYFSFELPAGISGYFYLGFEPSKTKMFVVNGDSEIQFNGSCHDPAAMVTVGSLSNDQYQRAIQYQQNLFNQFVNVIQQYRFTSGDPAKVGALDQQMIALDKLKRRHLDSLKKANPFLAKQAGMNTYYSYQGNKLSPTQTEGQYLAEHFLANLDFSDPDNYRNPAFFETVKNYAFNLGRQEFSIEQQRAFLSKILAKAPEGSANHQTILFAFVVGSLNGNEANVAFYGKQYLARYRQPNDGICAFLDEQLAKMPIVIGEEAPNIEDATPDGKTYSLKAMRGKVVLVDFWASWCGPCRRANPHVVELYHKYKDQGFDVLGVSLDQNKEKWIKAIQDDNLTWHHVSDLGGWQSKWARTYGVNAIPHALLIDREGRVIANKINPGELENYIRKALGL